MELTEFLARNPVADPVSERPEATGAADRHVVLTGRLESATDDAVLLRLGGSVVRILREDVADAEPDPSPPLIEPDGVHVQLRVRAEAQLRVETAVSATTLAGAGLRPMVAAQPSQARQFAVFPDQQGTVPLIPQQLISQTPDAGQLVQAGAGAPHTNSATGVTCQLACQVADQEPSGAWTNTHVMDTISDSIHDAWDD